MSESDLFELFATTPKGLELLLVDELRSLGAINPAEKLAGVSFKGDLEIAYKACLWSRLANRILLRLSQIPASTPEELYQGIQTIHWEDHLAPNGTLNIHFISSHSNITHTLFGAQKVKDAIVDQFRQKFSTRPSVTQEHPDVSIHVYLQRNIATISLDLSGESLHRRGYRLEQVTAPLKENLAAALLLRAGWSNETKNTMLFDPMCGSGTLLIEGALIAGNIAPGLFRDYFGFLKWKKHPSELWSALLDEAKKIRDLGLEQLPTMVGYDKDPQAIKIAFANIDRAGLRGKIHVEKRELSVCSPKFDKGLLITNPPYGERLGEIAELKKIYGQLGDLFKKEFVGWKGAVFTSNPDLGKSMGLRSYKQYAFFNGAIPSQLLLFDIQSSYFVDRSVEAINMKRIKRAQQSLNDSEKPLAEMFANRLRKNIKKFKNWADKENIVSYRLYDADLPEYAVAIDQFQSYICVQEYPAPKTVDPEKAKRRLQHIFSVISDVLKIEPPRIYFREQENSLADLDSLYPVQENDLRFLINLTDANREIGLPLEQRLLRADIFLQARDKHFLSLFTRAGSMSCVAALAKAKTVTSIFDDEFYYQWAQTNFANNNLKGQLIYQELFEWMQKNYFKFDIVFAEFPDSTFHLRQQHPELLNALVNLLSSMGRLYIVSKDPRFKLEGIEQSSIKFENVSSKFLPLDFERNSKIQQCWVLHRST